jgi:exonuclease SbcD
VTLRPGRQPLRLVHTSDLHLGDQSDGAVAKRALRALVVAAVDHRADAIVFAGDTFDHPRVDDELVRFFLSELSRFPGQVLLLPGNHDAFCEGSIYHRPTFTTRSPNIHLVGTGEPPAFVLPDLALEVVANATVEHQPSFRPLSCLPDRSSPDLFRLGVAHGHFRHRDDADIHSSSPILPEDILASRCDYVALGHWPRFADVSQGEVPAHYSGAPHKQGRLAHALLVTFGRFGLGDPATGACIRHIAL